MLKVKLKRRDGGWRPGADRYYDHVVLSMECSDADLGVYRALRTYRGHGTELRSKK